TLHERAEGRNKDDFTAVVFGRVSVVPRDLAVVELHVDLAVSVRVAKDLSFLDPQKHIIAPSRMPSQRQCSTLLSLIGESEIDGVCTLGPSDQDVLSAHAFGRR